MAPMLYVVAGSVKTGSDALILAVSIDGGASWAAKSLPINLIHTPHLQIVIAWVKMLLAWWLGRAYWLIASIKA
jgi:hypothetical protein